MSLLSIFGSAILPIIAIATVGFLLGKARDPDVGALNTITIYVLMPALVFHSMATTTLGGGTLVGIAVGVLLFTVVMAAIAEGAGRFLGEDEPVLGTFVLVSIFSNAGNYGIPVSEFAFGAVGRSTAVVYIVAQSIAMYTLGVYLAARGEGASLRSGVRAILSIPLIYAVIAAFAARWLGVVPAADTAVMETVKLVGDSAIPVMLLILGIELAEVDYGATVVRVTPATVLKMIVAPVVAIAIAVLVDFQNATVARVFILECSMPAAVTALILTGEFAGATDSAAVTDADTTGLAGPTDSVTASEFAGTAIFLSTVVSVPLLTGLIALLQSGIVV